MVEAGSSGLGPWMAQRCRSRDLVSKVCNLLEFKLDCSPSTKISFIVDRIIDRHGWRIVRMSRFYAGDHLPVMDVQLFSLSFGQFSCAGGSISDLQVCVNRFHPEEIVGRAGS